MMFETFTFDTARSPSLDSQVTTSTQSESRSVSPCSFTSPWATPDYSVTDLAADFQRQRLRQNSQIYSQACETYANLDDDAGWTLDEQENADLPVALSTRLSGSRSFSPTRRRLDRQAHTRLLCSSAHHRDIATLVTTMVSRKDQCMVQPPTSISYNDVSQTMVADTDDADFAPLSRTSSSLSASRCKDLRRASDLYKTGASVRKDVRFRRERPRRQKSNDK